MLEKRGKIVKEIEATEQTYVASLHLCMQVELLDRRLYLCGCAGLLWGRPYDKKMLPQQLCLRLLLVLPAAVALDSSWQKTNHSF